MTTSSSVDVAANGIGGLIIVTFIDPVRFRFVVRRSTDLGRTWSLIQPIPGLGTADPYSGSGALHHLYYDDQSQLFYLSFPYGYLTTTDGIAWSSLRSWGTFTAAASSNPGQSRKVRSFRTNSGTWLRYGNVFNSTADMSLARFGNGVCDTLACWPTQQIELWKWRVADTTPPSQEQRSMLHTPGAAFYMPASSTPDRIHLLFGATGLTGFRSTPRGHLFHWWSDDDGRAWSNENGVAGGQGFDTSIAGAADAETPIPEPPTGPLADIDAAWVPGFGAEGQLVVWGVEGNNANNAPGLSFSVFANGERDQTRVQGIDGYTTCSNTRPTLSLPSDLDIFLHDGLAVTASFTDPDADQTWTGTVDYPDNVGPIPLEFSADQTFALIHLFKEPGTYDVRVVVTDSAGSSAAGGFTVTVIPKRVMLYVHGTTGNFRQDPQDPKANDMPSLFARLFDRYALRFYQYYEDRGLARSENDLACEAEGRRELPAIDLSSGLPLSPGYPDPADPPPGICDSNDDVGLNAVLLDSDVLRLGKDFDRVTILSNSGGGRIVRTFLAYSAAAGTGAVDIVDQVIFLGAVHQGTYLTVVYDDIDHVVSQVPEAVIVRDHILDAVKTTVEHDPRRPLFDDVRPGSAIIRYTNVSVPVPNGPHYINVNGDMRVHIHQSVFLIPFETNVVEFGDFVTLPGEDDPRAMPERGGARFLPSRAGRGRSSTEWELTRDFNVNFDPTILNVVIIQQIADLVEAPEMHMNLGAQMDQICVRFGGVRRLDEVLFHQIEALDRGPHPEPGKLGFRASQVKCP